MDKSKLPQIIGKIVDTYDREDGINHYKSNTINSRIEVLYENILSKYNLKYYIFPS